MNMKTTQKRYVRTVARYGKSNDGGLGNVDTLGV